MSFTNNYFRNILLLAVLLLYSQCLKASDSLKVKKIEYFEDGKLVRAVYFDSLENNIKDFSYNYSEYFDEETKNGVELRKYSGKRVINYTNYLFKIDSINVNFFQGNYIGYLQRAKYDSLGRIIESNSESIFFAENYLYRATTLDSLGFIPVEYRSGFKMRMLYDHLGNMIEKKRMDRPFHHDKISYKYDSLNRLIEIKNITKLRKSDSNISYHDTITVVTTIVKEQLRILEKTINKIVTNEFQQVTRKEKYVSPLKDYKVIGNPKLTFTQENIYEKDRIVKIIYTDHILNKTKIHELKYEFY